MNRRFQSKQSGISFIGLLFVVGVLACLGVLMGWPRFVNTPRGDSLTIV